MAVSLERSRENRSIVGTPQYSKLSITFSRSHLLSYPFIPTCFILSLYICHAHLVPPSSFSLPFSPARCIFPRRAWEACVQGTCGSRRRGRRRLVELGARGPCPAPGALRSTAGARLTFGSHYVPRPFRPLEFCSSMLWLVCRGTCALYYTLYPTLRSEARVDLPFLSMDEPGGRALSLPPSCRRSQYVVHARFISSRRGKSASFRKTMFDVVPSSPRIFPSPHHSDEYHSSPPIAFFLHGSLHVSR